MHVYLQVNTCQKEIKKGKVNACKEERKEEFVTISPTIVEVTSFNILDNQIFSALALIDSNGHIYIEDI